MVEQISCVLIVVEYDCRIGTKVKPNLKSIITDDIFGLRYFYFWRRYQLSVSLNEPLCSIGEQAWNMGNMEEGAEEGEPARSILRQMR